MTEQKHSRGHAALPSLVLIGGPPFFGATSSVQQRMALAWHRLGGRVLYLELGGSAAPIRSRLDEVNRRCAEAQPGLHVMRLRALPGLPWSYPDSVRRMNLRRNLPAVLETIEELGFVSGRFVALYYGWYWEEWLEALQPLTHVYDCIDEHRAYPHIVEKPAHVKYVWEHERRMLARADLLAATSAALLEERAALTRRSLLLPNAVDSEAWRASAENSDCLQLPSDLAELPEPRIVLLGHLQPKLDFAAVDALARAREDAGIAMIGPKERGTRLPKDRANLRWLGAKPYDQVSAYLAHANAGLLPLLPTPYNRASCPLKLFEYLAAGLPVAASRIPAAEELERLRPFAVHLSGDAQDLPRAVTAALNANKTHTRQEFRACVKDRTWEQRVRNLLDALRK